MFLRDKALGHDLGHGIVVNYDEMFAEVALQAVSSLDAPMVTDADLQLPEVANGEHQLSPKLVKCVIKWKCNRLSMSRAKSKSSSASVQTKLKSLSGSRSVQSKPSSTFVLFSQSRQQSLDSFRQRLSQCRHQVHRHQPQTTLNSNHLCLWNGETMNCFGVYSRRQTSQTISSLEVA